jgi:mono/diheme cytochrome c family protein
MTRFLALCSLLGIQLVAVAPLHAQDKGATVYAAQKCSLCHSLDAKGNAKGPLDNVGGTLKADDIRQWIVNPVEMAAKAKATRKPAMKAYTLPKEDLDALVAFLAAKKKA